MSNCQGNPFRAPPCLNKNTVLWRQCVIVLFLYRYFVPPQYLPCLCFTEASSVDMCSAAFLYFVCTLPPQKQNGGLSQTSGMFTSDLTSQAPDRQDCADRSSTCSGTIVASQWYYPTEQSAGDDSLQTSGQMTNPREATTRPDTLHKCGNVKNQPCAKSTPLWGSFNTYR